jgi:hypothetical protein
MIVWLLCLWRVLLLVKIPNHQRPSQSAAICTPVNRAEPKRPGQDRLGLYTSSL